MGIYIKLKPQEFHSTREHALARIAFGGEVWEAFEGWFYPTKVELWKNASLTQVGGVSKGGLTLDQISTTSKVMSELQDRFRGENLEDLLASVIVVQGVWRIANQSMTGYISINNSYPWRQTYLDIEVDGHTHSDEEDFADVVLTAPDMGETFVKEFTNKLTGVSMEAVKLSAIYFFEGPVSRSEIYKAKVVYYPSPTELVRDMLSSYKAELREKNEQGLLSSLIPYKDEFLISAMFKTPEFQTDLSTILSQSQILQVQHHSILYVGRRKDSFRDAYTVLSEKALKNVARNLPSAGLLGQDIARALGSEQTRMDE